MSDRRFRAVVFDGGGIFSLAADAGGTRYWERKLGLEPGAIRRMISPELNRQANLGLLTDEEVWARALAPLGLDAAALRALAEDFWAGSFLDYDVAGLIERVRAAGYCTALLSNAWLSARASHTALGWDRLLRFDVQMFSAEEGLMKPDPAFYRRCLDRLGVCAAEALFVDDSLPNVQAARGLGMTALHYTLKRRDIPEIERLLGLGESSGSTSGNFGGYDAQWVHPRIAVGRWPRPEDVPGIAAAGVRGILNLVNYCFREQMLYVAALPADLAWLHCGIWDGWTDESQHDDTLNGDHARWLARTAAAFLRDHGPILVHCWSGARRTGSVAALLVAALEGISLPEATERIRLGRPVISRYTPGSIWGATPEAELIRIAREQLA